MINATLDHPASDIRFEIVKGCIRNMKSYFEEKSKRKSLTPERVEDCTILIEQLEDILRIAEADGTEPMKSGRKFVGRPTRRVNDNKQGYSV